MQAACSFKAAAVAPRSVARPSRRQVAVSALSARDVAKGAAAAAASLALVLGPGAPAQAAAPTPSAYEQSSAYTQELLEGLKARGAKELPKLTDAPKGAAVETAAVPALKLSGFEKTTVEVPPEVPAPLPAAPATVTPPKPTPAAPAPKPAPVEAEEAPKAAAPAAVAAAPKPAAAPAAPRQFGAPAASDAGDNKGLLVGGAVAAVAIVAVVASGAGGQGEAGQEGAAAAAGSAAAAPSAPAAAAGGVPPNVAEARQWIAAWRARQQK